LFLFGRNFKEENHQFTDNQFFNGLKIAILIDKQAEKRKKKIDQVIPIFY
jgi:hypothetical protein